MLLQLSGCGATGMVGQASGLDLHAQRHLGPVFEHRIYRAPSKAQSLNPAEQRAPLIVLLDGDGRAFLNRTTVALDPTPQRSWLLAAMPDVAELTDVLYLGRPCYLGTMTDACHPRYWTTHRFAPEIVESLVRALQASSAGRPLILVGYSGGGVLAMLLAERLQEQVLGLLTLAAPLDLDAWTEYHDYSPLLGSMRPKVSLEGHSSLCQRSLYGAKDKEVPLALAHDWHRLKPAQLRTVPERHSCCWKRPLMHQLQEILSHCRER